MYDPYLDLRPGPRDLRLAKLKRPVPTVSVRFPLLRAIPAFMRSEAVRSGRGRKRMGGRLRSFP
jgi:hypothetical protein